MDLKNINDTDLFIYVDKGDFYKTIPSLIKLLKRNFNNLDFGVDEYVYGKEQSHKNLFEEGIVKNDLNCIYLNIKINKLFLRNHVLPSFEESVKDQRRKVIKIYLFRDTHDKYPYIENLQKLIEYININGRHR